MDDSDPIFMQLLLQLFFILLNAVFACGEIAVLSINDNKLAKMAEGGDKRAVRLVKLTAQPAHFLSVIQVAITLAGFLGSAFAADNFSKKLVAWFISIGVKIPISTLETISVIIVTLILSYFTLILGELVPKRIAMRNAEKVSLAMSGLIYIISKLFAPIVYSLTLSTNGILRLLGIDPNADDENVTEEEIRLMVDAGSERGAIDPNEKEFIHNIFDFDDKTAEEIMTHRTQVSILWLDENVMHWETAINESAHSVYPVCDKNADNVIGILKLKDFYRHKDKGFETIKEQCIKPAYFIPETIRTDILFQNMKERRNHFAIAIDEYGGMSGIITMNDLLEELVGDLEDDSSAPVDLPPIECIDSQTWKIHGSAPLAMVTSQLKISLPENDYDTFGGFVFGLLGKIPDDGSTPEIEAHGLAIKVISIKDHRLTAAYVCLPKESNSET